MSVKHTALPAIALGALCVVTFLGSLALWRPPRELNAAVPARHRDAGYVGSGACQSCHPSEHASWSRTFHRTMTRVADHDSVEPRLPAKLELDGRSYEIQTSPDGRFEVTGPDLHAIAALARSNRNDDAVQRAVASLPRVTRELVMVTGSHHYQAFWVAGGEGRELRQLPFVYLLDASKSEGERWLPRRDAFLQPPETRPNVQRWNGNCVQCHSVAGRPGESSAMNDGVPESHFATSVAELGIACEACHGPGAEHTAHYRSPLARYLERGAARNIVNPEKLDSARSSAVCGQCHSYFVPQNEDDWWQSGFSASFRAGDPLAPSRLVLDYARDKPDDALLSRSLDSVFWPDGTIRVGGREYNGLVKSPCFERGAGDKKLACTSCHSMHESEPSDQLAQDMDSNRACTQCHENHEPRVSEHTHHATASSGSQCVSCHMPRTTYALLKSIRSHRITSPTVQSIAALDADEAQNGGAPQKKIANDAPNACNLCHLGESRAWAQEMVTEFWGSPEQKAESARRALAAANAQARTRPLPASVEWLLGGNAAQRVLLADAFAGEEGPGGPSREERLALLARLEHDPYAAVRFVAARSRAKLLATSAEAKAFKGWRARLDTAVLDALTAARNDEPITISE